MGLDVALEEINHLLEADMTDASRNVYKGEWIYLNEVPIKLSSSGSGPGRSKVRWRSGEGQEGQSQVWVMLT